MPEIRRRATKDVEKLATYARGGSPAARERLLRALYPIVHSWTLARMGDPLDADDVSQEAMLRIHDRLDEFRGGARFTSWAYRIVANVATDYGRRTTRKNRGRQPLAVVDTERRAVGGAESLDRQQALALVQDFVLSLPEGQRVVFHLVDLSDHTPAEVSDMLEMNRSTVRAHLFKARRTIRRRLLETHAQLVEDVRP